MTTTYELYTNENGTPKLVEGKAPAIIERVETLETSVETLEETLDNGVVTSVNGNTGDVKVDVGVTSVNGQTGAVSIDAGVTSVNGNTGDITPEQTGCLPLSGGTMTGELEFQGNRALKQTATTGRIQIYGGTSADNGSMLGVYGNDYTDRPGWIYCRVTDGTNGHALVAKPDGSLTWSTKNIVRSVNGSTADASGDVALAIPNYKQSKNDTLTKLINNNLTFTGLTPNKPVIIQIDYNGTSGGYYIGLKNVVSGLKQLWLTDKSSGDTVYLIYQGYIGIFLATSSTISFKLTGVSSTKHKGTITVYQ